MVLTDNNLREEKMVEKQKYQAYAAATQTVAPSRQIVMLYDGIIRCVQKARDAIVERRIEDRYNLLLKASELIGGLQACLDFEKGGDIANILYSYYAGIDARVFTIHRTNDVNECEAIIADLKQMRDAWEEIDRGETAPKNSANSSNYPSDNPEAQLPPPVVLDGMSLSA